MRWEVISEKTYIERHFWVVANQTRITFQVKTIQLDIIAQLSENLRKSYNFYDFPRKIF